jgi:hypothetical protein
MRPAETISGKGVGRIKKDGVYSIMIYLRTFVEVTMYPQYKNNNKKQIKN